MPDRSDLEARTRYDPSEVEPRIARVWLDSGLFHPQPEGSPEDNYSVAIPLPNVTGVLHMGHALNNSIQDCLIRFNRMRGRRAKWILGTDHAGIATQPQVERALVAEGTSRETPAEDPARMGQCPGMTPEGPRISRRWLSDREIDRAERSGTEAVDSERDQRPRLEVAH